MRQQRRPGATVRPVVAISPLHRGAEYRSDESAFGRLLAHGPASAHARLPPPEAFSLTARNIRSLRAVIRVPGSNAQRITAQSLQTACGSPVKFDLPAIGWRCPGTQASRELGIWERRWGGALTVCGRLLGHSPRCCTLEALFVTGQMPFAGNRGPIPRDRKLLRCRNRSAIQQSRVPPSAEETAGGNYALRGLNVAVWLKEGARGVETGRGGLSWRALPCERDSGHCLKSSTEYCPNARTTESQAAEALARS